MVSDKNTEAIVNLQLYRLTNTDVNVLKEEHANLLKVIQILQSILNDEEKIRRNNPTFFEKYGSKLAVLEGDLLLSLALEQISNTNIEISILSIKN